MGLVKDALERAAQGGSDFDYEHRLLMPDGSIKHLHDLAHSITNEAGNAEVVGAIMDITERKLAEEAILRSEAYLAEAQRLSHTGSFGWKPDTGEIVWSDEIYRIFEYDRSVKPTIDSSKIGQGARDQQGWRYIGLSKFQIDGIVSVIPTPFTPAEEIDWAALRSLLDFAAGADLSGVCLPAYASEFYKLSEAERREVIVVAVDHLRNKLPVMAQVTTRLLCRQFAQFGRRKKTELRQSAALYRECFRWTMVLC